MSIGRLRTLYNRRQALALKAKSDLDKAIAECKHTTYGPAIAAEVYDFKRGRYTEGFKRKCTECGAEQSTCNVTRSPVWP